jgi:hypothetical protein
MVEDLEGAEEHHWSLRYNEIASFMKEYMKLTKEPSVVDDTATPRTDYPLAETGADEVRQVDGEHLGEHDDQPPVRLLRDMIKMNNTEKEDPHNGGPGPGAVADQAGLRDHAAPGPEPEDNHQEDRLSYMHKPKNKTDFGDILVPNDQDQQSSQRRVATADSTHLRAGVHETHHVAGYDAMHVDTKYETTFEKAMQQTAPMDAKIKTHLKETTYVTDWRRTTDDDEMLADSTHQQGMYEAYKKEAAVSRTTTDDMRGIGSSKSCRQQAAAVLQGTGG